MTSHSRLAQHVGGLGIVFTVLFVAGYALTGGGTPEKDSGAAVVHYYTAHRGAQTAAVFLVALSAVAFVFFLAALRSTLARTEDRAGAGSHRHRRRRRVRRGPAVYGHDDVGSGPRGT